MLWEVIWLSAGVAFVLFVFVIAFGAPFLPTLKPQLETALDLAKLRPGDTLLELGSGDGRVLAAAAQRGITAIGYELNPLLVIYSWLRTRKYGSKVKVIWGSYWQKEWPPAQAIFVFLLKPYMPRLDNKIVQYYSKPVKLVSIAFEIPDRKPKDVKNGVFLYEYN